MRKMTRTTSMLN